MNPEEILNRLRSFLLVLSGAVMGGALIELWFTGHTEKPVQLIPFVLCGLGILTIFAVMFTPQRSTLNVLRSSMGVILLGSLFGSYEHIANNVAFQLEIHPDLTTMQKIAAGLGGANPLLAPGILGIAALIALAATYYHPALVEQD